MGDPFIGEIRMFGGNFAPRGWAMCDGQTMNISQNQPLFSLIGTTYGGDGLTTFHLPDLRGRLPVHQGTNPVTGTGYALGEMGGSETVTLRVPHLPQHTHTAMASAEGGGNPSPAGDVWGTSALNQYSQNPANATMHPNAIANEGGAQPHHNMMPFLPLTFIIALEGIWPSRT